MKLRSRTGCLIVFAAMLLLVTGTTPYTDATGRDTPEAKAAVAMDCNPSCHFEPRNLTVFAGTTVVWTGAGLAPHTSTSDTMGVWDSGTVLPGQSFSKVFDSLGVFSYHCDFHSLFGMAGNITVIAPSNQIFMPFIGRESSGF